jgi:hypothetical protein
MKQSVRNALEVARGALFSQQSELMGDIARINRSIDECVKNGKEVSSHDTSMLNVAKGRLADTVLARETLYSYELDSI